MSADKPAPAFVEMADENMTLTLEAALTTEINENIILFLASVDALADNEADTKELVLQAGAKNLAALEVVRFDARFGGTDDETTKYLLSELERIYYVGLGDMLYIKK